MEEILTGRASKGYWAAICSQPAQKVYAKTLSEAVGRLVIAKARRLRLKVHQPVTLPQEDPSG